MDMRNSLFAKKAPGGAPPARPMPGGPMQPSPSPRYNNNMQQQPAGYGSPRDPGGYGNVREQGGPMPGARQAYPSSQSGVMLSLYTIEDPNLRNQFVYGNICAVSANDFRSPDGSDVYIKLSGPEMAGSFVVTARPLKGFPDGCIYLSDPQRTWCGVGLKDQLIGEVYNPFQSGNQAYLGSMDVEIGFASQRRTREEQYDQEHLQSVFVKNFANQIMAPGQRILMDLQSTPLMIVVKTVNLVDLSLEKRSSTGGNATNSSNSRGILVPQTKITFFKDAKSTIKLKASSMKAAPNAIISPDFDFKTLGIGGLDDEFATIFRRAFASRIFPPGLIEKLGIMHCKGILLYGPPGTGKTLIARKIGGLLNAREPIVVNGPELLNKYVGASEENVRKLFAEAEKEYKAKGDDSDLHIIIFDELDAVCKQRGSGAGGGTGVGDSIVNQLLSKLDGVDQLNNILLIGMTNRKDMIDEALLRPGRLEIQVEISLPDEAGRVQILNIHTAKMKENNVMAPDVDIKQLAARTKNFSGAEIAGLVKSATSFAFNRHTKIGSMAGVGDVENLKVTMGDFVNALSEVTAAYGVADEELEEAITYGIIHFSPGIRNAINSGIQYAQNVRQLPHQRRLSVLISGPSASGKTALAAHIARRADYPFTKLVTPQSLVAFRDEFGRRDQLHKSFADAYKSPLSILLIDNIERLIEWNPVGPRFSTPMLQTLLTLLQAPPPKEHRLLILATTSRRSVLEQLDVIDYFDREITVPSVGTVQELGAVLSEMQTFDSQADLNEVLNLVDNINGGKVGVGIKDVLGIADETANYTEGGSTKVDWFVDQLSAKIMKNSVPGY